MIHLWEQSVISPPWRVRVYGMDWHGGRVTPWGLDHAVGSQGQPIAHPNSFRHNQTVANLQVHADHFMFTFNMKII